MKTEVLGVGFDGVTTGEAVLRASQMLSGGEKGYIVTPNPEIVWMARRNPELRAALSGASLSLPDGIGIILGAKILGTPLPEKVAGIDFIEALFKAAAPDGARVFLLGAKPGVAQAAGLRLAEKYPGLTVAGTSDGYFTDTDAVVAMINGANADILLVCLGAPKQELWMSENIKRLDVRAAAGLGGALDVFAGVLPRAPMFFRRLELEWLYRLIREPRRIKRALKLPLFVLAVIGRRLWGRR